MASAQRGRVERVTRHWRTRRRTREELEAPAFDGAKTGAEPADGGGPKRSTSRAAACATMGASSGSRWRASSLSSAPAPGSATGASTDASTTSASVASFPAPASVEIRVFGLAAASSAGSPTTGALPGAAPIAPIAPPADKSIPPLAGSSMNMLRAVSTSRRVFVARSRWPSRALIESESAQSDVRILRAARWMVLASSALTAGAPVLSMLTVDTTRLSHAAPSPSARAERWTLVWKTMVARRVAALASRGASSTK
mmetsp:Transcript_34462/g.91437  ORF Transcript_34462/g.91437 Transcript_34462/m.91437 type:complete len:256 (+) Transcript_34462:548-1315(+)